MGLRTVTNEYKLNGHRIFQALLFLHIRLRFGTFLQ
jgi:hypothetical protein